MRRYNWPIYIPIYICCLFIAWIPSTSSKNKYTCTNDQAIQLYEEAMQVYIQKRYEDAIDLLEQARKKDKKFVEVYLQLATIYKELEEFGRAERFLDQGKSYLPLAKVPQLHYDLAQLYYRVGAYKKASDAVNRIPLRAINSNVLLTKIQALQQNLQLALNMLQRPWVFNPRRLPFPLNQFISQYFPVITVDQQTILFTALVDQGEGKYKENIYTSQKDESGNWSIPVSISAKINEVASNQGTCTISADKKTLVFTACSKEGNYGVCDLYISYNHQGEWSTPENLGPHINSKGWQSQPSLSADGKTLYFVSERKGNYGKNDIWKSTWKESGQWSEPVNLGPTINSKDREVGPFIHPNGQTLFFASDRTPSMGGFDIYYSNFINGQWTEPVNLGYPINNHQDQVSIFITADGKKGYYADGKRKDLNYHSSHIYEFDMPENLVPMPKSEVVQLKVLDAQTKKPTGAQVEVYDMEDVLQQKLAIDPTDGQATIVVNEGKEYLIYITKDGHLFESKHINLKNRDKALVNSAGEIWLRPIEVSQSKILENIYFDYDDYRIMTKSHTELNRLVAFLQSNPSIHIELEGHTDHMGSDAYNKQLSIKRAQTIYDYLIQAGIEVGRLTYQGYGKTQPLVENTSPENQQLNRRVAFRITKLNKHP